MSQRTEIINRRIAQLKATQLRYITERDDPYTPDQRRKELSLAITHLTWHIDDLETYR